MAKEISNDASHATLVQHMKDVKKVMGSKGGTTLKNLIYDVFQSEVGEKPMGEVIR